MTTTSPRPGFRLDGATALVTGANRGLGRHLTEQLLARGAKVYATARRPETIDVPGAVPLQLDVTDEASVAAAAQAASDTTLVINNSGVSLWTDLVTSDLAGIETEVDTNLWGPLRVVRAFAPVLAAHGGGAILNVLSAQSWFAYPSTHGYHVSKAATWALTNGIRLELEAQGTLVSGVHIGPMDTEMSSGYEGAKVSPAEVARRALDGLEAGEIEILADDWSAHVKRRLAEHPSRLYEEILAGIV